MRLLDAVESFGDYMEVERNASPLTVRAYYGRLENTIQFLGNLELSCIKAFQLTEYLNQRRDLSPASRAHAIAVFKSFFTWAKRKGHVKANVAADLERPRLPRRLPKAVDVSTIHLLHQQAEKTFDRHPFKRTNLRNAFILELLYGTGLRAAELCGLNVDDFTLDDTRDGRLRVVGKGSKERIVYTYPRLTYQIVRWLEKGRAHFAAPDEPALIVSREGHRLATRSLRTIVQQIGNEAGIKVTPHTFRHSFATSLLEGGADIRQIQEMLGHANLNTTQIYTKVTPRAAKQALMNAHPLAK